MKHIDGEKLLSVITQTETIGKSLGFDYKMICVNILGALREALKSRNVGNLAADCGDLVRNVDPASEVELGHTETEL